MGLSNMEYKSFVFPNNPETTSFECDKSYVKHKYPSTIGNEIEDFGANAIVITGSGEFFGINAYNTFSALYNEFQQSGVGKVSHPIFTQITRGIMTKLKADLEPKDNYVKYSFEIVADSEPNVQENIGAYAIVEIVEPVYVEPAQAQPNVIVHTVVSGECLSVICYNYSQQYGVDIDWHTIADNNNMSNPNLIYPGDQITITW